MDNSIRFADKIVDRRLALYARPKNAIPYLDEEMANMVYYQVSVRAMMSEMFNGKLGKTRWVIAARDNVKLITVFQDDGILILSTELHCDHDKIVRLIHTVQ